ncbi:signal peptidase II [uncultured Ruthenibacterium sp.]|uniref:signal peptidase II n=1 Tax=uncultured Ruthenibacterium sp. TaxID=1905347 RepID=UPI00349E6815
MFSIILVTILLVLVDHFTKFLATTYLAPLGSVTLIPGVMDLRYVLNDGVAFGMFAGGNATTILLIVTGVVIAAFAAYLFVKRPQKRLERISMILILSGGLGNFIDRLLNKAVVDFFATTFMDFPVFNVADCFVTIGVVLLIVSVFQDEMKEKKITNEQKSSNEQA